MTDPKDITTPLLITVPGNGPAPQLNEALTLLLGTWSSPPSTNSATGYNVMPLPSTAATPGYINKNFLYYEELTFTSPGNAPNRGGKYTQQCQGVTYEQRVYFADGPDENMLVHFENGLWLNLVSAKQMVNAYAKTPVIPIDPLPPQNPEIEMVKQVSVPHGNSILATGTVTAFTGQPSIPSSVLTDPPFAGASPAIPDPNLVLTDRNNYLVSKGVTFSNGHMISVKSTNPGGHVDNIMFEDRHAKVTVFETTYWLSLLSNTGGRTGEQWQLQYSQTMTMELLVKGSTKLFLHVDANSLLKPNDGPYLYTDPSLGKAQGNFPLDQKT